MSQKSAKTLRRIDRSNTNLCLRMARLEADVRELQAGYGQLVHQVRRDRTNSQSMSRELSIVSREQRKRALSRQRINLLVSSAAVIICLISVSLKIFGVL
ncbi:MAG: hypothetical protein SOR83_07095 [Butyricicoccus pullicaecorum]|nr:hypothetical protein [Butyricicoccus pullicaecorum]